MSNWAPERIWLQRGVGPEGCHTWCEDQIGEDSIGDALEEVEYVRVDEVLEICDLAPDRAAAYISAFDRRERRNKIFGRQSRAIPTWV